MSENETIELIYLIYLRNQAYIDLSTRQGSLHCYESTATAHQFHNPNSMICTMCLIINKGRCADILCTDKKLSMNWVYMTKNKELYTSMYAEFIALCASSTAVSKPKVLSINKISLSIVLGTPITDTFNRLLQHYMEENISAHINKDNHKVACQAQKLKHHPKTFWTAYYNITKFTFQITE